jgi:hypothetical protein
MKEQTGRFDSKSGKLKVEDGVVVQSEPVNVVYTAIPSATVL